MGRLLWSARLRQKIYLGDEDFVERMQAVADPERLAAREVPKHQRRVQLSFSDWLKERDEAIFNACNRGGMTLTQVAKELGLSVSRVSRIVRMVGEARGKT